MQEGVRLAAPPDGRDQRIGDELGGRGIAHRPAHHPTGEQVSHSGHLEPSFRCPDVGEVSHPLLVGPVGSKLAIQHVTGNDRAFPLILGQSTATGPGPQPLRLHEPFDPMQAIGAAFGKQVMPETAGTVGAIAASMARPDPGADHLVVAGARRRGSS